MPVTGYVEGLHGAHLRGWVLSDESRCQVSMADAAGNVVASGTASGQPQDAGTGVYRVAFRILVDVSDPPAALRVFADGHELAGSPVVLGPGKFDGALHVRDGVISGWVQERCWPNQPQPVQLRDQHGRLLATLVPRAESEHGPHAFSCDVPPVLYGWPEIGLYATCRNNSFAKATCRLPVNGHLDVVEPGRLAGWAMIPALPDKQLALRVSVDGEPVSDTTCHLLRSDLATRLAHLPTERLRYGFDASWPDATEATAAGKISLRLAESDVEILRGPYGIADLPWATTTLRKAAEFLGGHKGLSELETSFLRHRLATLARDCRTPGARLAFKAAAEGLPQPRLSIIIPVYRDVDATRACIESVLADRRCDTDAVIVIDDHSPDPAMRGMLESLLSRTENCWLLVNPDNRGFIGSVNRGLAMAGGGDVLLLNSDAEFHPGGIDELVRCAQLSDAIGSVTPLSNAATIFTYPHPEIAAAELPDLSWADVAALARAQPRQVVDVPTGHGFCLLIKRAVLEQVGELDTAFGRGYGEENDLCQRIADLGYRNVAAPTVFVRHRESASFGADKDGLRAANLRILRERYPEYQARIDQWLREDPLRKGRWPIDRERLRNAVARGRRFVVSVENALTGGTARAIADIERNVGYGERTVVRCRVERDLIKLSVEPLRLLSVYRSDDAEDLFATLESLHPELILVHQLLGFSEAFVRRLTALGGTVRTIFFAHDFYAVCPRTTMIDAAGEFCGGPSARCEGCVAVGGTHERCALAVPPTRHRALMGEFVRGCHAVVAPSNDTAERLRAALPELDVMVVPHPALPDPPAVGGGARNRDRVVSLGAIGPHKGSAMLIRLARLARIDAPALRFHIVGHTDCDRDFEALDNVVLHGEYRHEQLPALLAGIDAATAVFLHRWPETYSYTLSEAVLNGMVPIAVGLGAIPERMQRMGIGGDHVVADPNDAHGVLRAIRGFRRPGRPDWLRTLTDDATSAVTALRRLINEEDPGGKDHRKPTPAPPLRKTSAARPGWASSPGPASAAKVAVGR